MQSYRIVIEPVSPGTQEGQKTLVPGDGTYLTLPEGQRRITLLVSSIQVVGIQGYLTLIAAGADTSAIETAITGVGPT